MTSGRKSLMPLGMPGFSVAIRRAKIGNGVERKGNGLGFIGGG
jgi:hypothetical protein